MKRDDVLNELYSSRFWKDIKVDFVKEAKRVRTMKEQADFLNKYSYYMLYNSPMSTIKGRALDMRKELIKSGIKEGSPLVSFFKLHTNLYTSMNNKYAKKIEDKLSKDNNKREDEKINYFELLQQNIQKLLNGINDSDTITVSNNSRISREIAYQKIIVLALATGRRQIEIMKLLELRKKKENALYLNLAKKKNSDDDSIVAPIFIDINLAKKFLKDIKEEFKTNELTNKQVNSKFNGSVAKSLYRYLDEDIATKGFHFLRAVYAEACYQKFGGDAEKNVYFQEILGHSVKLNAGHSYEAKIK